MRRRRERARDDEFGLLLGPLLAQSGLLEEELLPRLTVKDLFALAGVNRSCREALSGLEGMAWLRDREAEWSVGSGTKGIVANACTVAATEGKLKVLQWLRAHGCEWDQCTCAGAAEGGHLVVLQWARENGCEWDEDTCAEAARGGHLEVLQWARENGCEWDEETCAYAILYGEYEVVDWAVKNGCPR